MLLGLGRAGASGQKRGGGHWVYTRMGPLLYLHTGQAVVDRMLTDLLNRAPFLDAHLGPELRRQLPEYVAEVMASFPAATGYPDQQGSDDQIHTERWSLRFWVLHRLTKKFDSWVRLTRILLLLHPTSAASERAFSVLETGFTAQQRTAMHDYIESIMMRKFNGA